MGGRRPPLVEVAGSDVGLEESEEPVVLGMTVSVGPLVPDSDEDDAAVVVPDEGNGKMGGKLGMMLGRIPPSELEELADEGVETDAVEVPAGGDEFVVGSGIITCVLLDPDPDEEAGAEDGVEEGGGGSRMLERIGTPPMMLGMMPWSSLELDEVGVAEELLEDEGPLEDEGLLEDDGVETGTWVW